MRDDAMTKFRVVTSEKELDSLAMRGSLERVRVGRCTIGFTHRDAGRGRSRDPYPWTLDVIGGHEDGGAYPLDSYRTLLDAYRAAGRISRALDEVEAEPDLVELARRFIARKAAKDIVAEVPAPGGCARVPGLPPVILPPRLTDPGGAVDEASGAVHSDADSGL